MTNGLSNLKHIVVVMMQGRSFDHMLGDLTAEDSRINGLTGNESNLDAQNEPAKVQPRAKFQGQLDPAPAHDFPAVQKQLFGGNASSLSTPSMGGFVQSYFDQHQDAEKARKIMYYFQTEKLPVLQSLARSYALFNGWFSSVPGSTVSNHMFTHYGTSFGNVGMGILSAERAYASIFERLLTAGRSAKAYRYDSSSSIFGIGLQNSQPRILATYSQFLADCAGGTLPEYSFVAPSYADHIGVDGVLKHACDQHPGHDVQVGEIFLASVYNAIRQNPSLWKSTALLIVYADHGGIFDHVPPPSCSPDGFTATAEDTGTGESFAFNRLGVRVPAILVSPWVAKRTVVVGPEDPHGRTFEHSSITSTVTRHFIGDYHNRSPREKAAQTFLDLLSDQLRPDSDCLVFSLAESPVERSRPSKNVQAFLCHASSDKERVRKLHHDLLKDGIDPWLDEENLLPGQEWELEIARAIAGSDIVVVCLSGASVTKTGYVQKEIKQALDHADKRPEGAIFLIPARFEECAIPERLARWHCVDLFHNGGYAKLLRSIKLAKSNG